MLPHYARAHAVRLYMAPQRAARVVRGAVSFVTALCAVENPQAAEMRRDVRGATAVVGVGCGCC